MSEKPPLATHEGYFWMIPVWCHFGEGMPKLWAKSRLLDPFIPAVAWMDETTGHVCEWLNPAYEWTGFALRVREVRRTDR